MQTTSWAWIAGCIFLGACGADVYSVTQERAYSPAEFRHAASREIATVVHGNPFQQPDTDVRGAVLDAMQATRWSHDVALVRPAKFIAVAPGTVAPDCWIAVYLVGGQEVRPEALCTPVAATGGRVSAGDLAARMAFCRGTQVLSTSVGSAGGINGPDDRRFGQMISSMTRELFPHREYRREGPAEGRLRR